MAQFILDRVKRGKLLAGFEWSGWGHGGVGVGLHLGL